MASPPQVPISILDLSSDILGREILPRLSLADRFGALLLVSHSCRQLSLAAPLLALNLSDIPKLSDKLQIAKKERFKSLNMSRVLKSTSYLFEEIRTVVAEVLSSFPLFGLPPLKTVEFLKFDIPDLCLPELEIIASYFPDLVGLEAANLHNHVSITSTLGHGVTKTLRVPVFAKDSMSEASQSLNISNKIKRIDLRDCELDVFPFDLSGLESLKIELERNSVLVPLISSLISKNPKFRRIDVNFPISANCVFDKLTELSFEVDQRERAYKEGGGDFEFLSTPSALHLEYLSVKSFGSDFVKLKPFLAPNLRVLKVGYFENMAALAETEPPFDFPSLEQLSISYNKKETVLNRFINCKNIRFLSFSLANDWTEVHLGDIDLLAHFPKLRALKFDANITETHVDNLRPILPNLEIFSISISRPRNQSRSTPPKLSHDGLTKLLDSLTSVKTLSIRGIVLLPSHNEIIGRLQFLENLKLILPHETIVSDEWLQPLFSLNPITLIRILRLPNRTTNDFGFISDVRLQKFCEFFPYIDAIGGLNRK